ncbi:hypothetical protein DLEV_186 [Diachasmimorpha longicaudata entomopoxvirus]|uniref:Uncharacterized protein n=1 Tax=Diachasmimorpha longicaudata entomopoxvirus TaxID=109981 RepID=A0A7R5WLV2_9POXV|nr:hypothetical protein QKK69_gp008 [Diachasmimorpha longicaudata entomopoxvirus]YP_010796933.1 hypothetical protein QKK69_gp186 [Diachasmimorpha longicaudata entomopoxvirus]AKS26299.1 hypothetical protein DLEV_008 [Diachasmimorpha longicaudata entomopoxvirus]AKS26477.1 hypothetical protein DLEV_186 [Diachasmimorpha longicaudata entomopoxvirus]
MFIQEVFVWKNCVIKTIKTTDQIYFNHSDIVAGCIKEIFFSRLSKAIHFLSEDEYTYNELCIKYKQKLQNLPTNPKYISEIAMCEFVSLLKFYNAETERYTSFLDSLIMYIQHFNAYLRNIVSIEEILRKKRIYLGIFLRKQIHHIKGVLNEYKPIEIFKMDNTTLMSIPPLISYTTLLDEKVCNIVNYIKFVFTKLFSQNAPFHLDRHTISYLTQSKQFQYELLDLQRVEIETNANHEARFVKWQQVKKNYLLFLQSTSFYFAI